jgi:hypothetical protein
MQTLQITAPHFCAGVVFGEELVARAAPILRYMQGWNRAQVLGYAQKKGWAATWVQS